MTARIGEWMQTFGGVFWPLDPREDEVSIEDIAHALSNLCRFGGHGRFYSVAQHSVLVSLHLAQRDAMWGLLHDAAEAYTQDVIRPVKHTPFMREYRDVERAIMRVIARRFCLDGDRAPESVERADMILLATEARDIMGGQRVPWKLPFPPLCGVIAPWAPEDAERSFLARFHELGGVR